MKQRGNVLITGASQGLGYEFAKLFAKENFALFLVARNKDNLTQIGQELREGYKVPVEIFTKDLSVPVSARELVSDLKGREIDILINNAGFATHGAFVEIPLDEELNQINVDVTTLTLLTKLLLKGMIERGYGRILNISSTAAFQPGPLMAVYYASKAYVLSFSEALSEEVRGSGVSVTALCPGPTNTGFSKRAHMESTALFKNTMEPQVVAKAGYDGLMQGKRVVVVGLRNTIMAFFAKYIPHSFTLPVIKKLQRV